MTTAEFWDVCSKHNWFWKFEDNSKRYLEGAAEDRRLEKLSWERWQVQGLNDFMLLVKAFRDAHDVSQGDNRPPIPARPNGTA